MTFLAHRLSSIKPSATLTITAKAAQLKQQGHDVITLSTGEPDFDTPFPIKQAAREAIEKGLTKYTAVDGMPQLKKAIQQKFHRDNNLNYNLDEITVGNGGKQILFNALMATLNPKDEVIICAPYWVSYPDIVYLFEGIPTIVQAGAENNFKITATQLQAAITPFTKWFILNSPCNPTGAVYTPEELKALACVLEKNPHVYILSDDIYEYLIYGNSIFTSILEVAPFLKERTLVLNGVSKSYAMTGWRIGYGAGPSNLIKAMTMLQSQSTSNACSISQAAAIEALQGNHHFLKDWKIIFERRRNFSIKEFNTIAGLSCTQSPGAFYLYINCFDLMGKTTPAGTVLKTDSDFAHYLLETAQVAVVCGEAFGLSPYFRISYATSDDLLKKAITRIASAVESLT